MTARKGKAEAHEEVGEERRRGGGKRAAQGDSEDGEGARRRKSGREEEMRAFLAQSVAHRLEGVNKAVIAGCDAAWLLGRRLAACACVCTTTRRHVRVALHTSYDVSLAQSGTSSSI